MSKPRNEGPLNVWTVLETAGAGSRVVAVKSDEGAAKIAARVQRARWSADEAWRVTVSGPHEVSRDYI